MERYSQALELLDAYDHQTMTRPRGNQATYILTYEECRKVIDSMRFGDSSSLFGNEKDDSFKGSIGAIYQSFGGRGSVPYFGGESCQSVVFCHEEPQLFRWQQADCSDNVSVFPGPERSSDPGWGEGPSMTTRWLPLPS